MHRCRRGSGGGGVGRKVAGQRRDGILTRCSRGSGGVGCIVTVQGPYGIFKTSLPGGPSCVQLNAELTCGLVQVIMYTGMLG